MNTVADPDLEPRDRGQFVLLALPASSFQIPSGEGEGGMDIFLNCTFSKMSSTRKYLYPSPHPTEGIGISWGVGRFSKTKKFKEMYQV